MLAKFTLHCLTLHLIEEVNIPNDRFVFFDSFCYQSNFSPFTIDSGIGG